MSTQIAADSAGIAAAARHLAAGGLVALPTETVYGLAADATQPAAIARVFAVKGRPSDHPLIVHLAQADEAPRWVVQWPEGAVRLAAAFWPGPLTLILPKSQAVSPLITGGQDTVALRVPAHPVARAVIAQLGRAVVAPSANRFGRVSPTCAEHVLAEFPAEPDLLVLDAGACPVGVESTIVDASRIAHEGLVLLRQGAIGAREIAAVAGVPVREAFGAVRMTEPTAVVPEGTRGCPLYPPLTGAGEAATRPCATSVRAPGMLPQHYAPSTPLWLVRRAEWPLVHARLVDEQIAYALWAPEELPASGILVQRLAQPAEAAALAQSLYASLRVLDAAGAEVLVVIWPEGDEPLIAAVQDRLRRAAANGNRG